MAREREREAGYRSTLSWGLTVLYKFWHNIDNKGSFRNLTQLQKLKKYLWLFSCSYLVVGLPPLIMVTWFSSVRLEEENRCRAQSRKKKWRALQNGIGLSFTILTRLFWLILWRWDRGVNESLNSNIPKSKWNYALLLRFSNKVISHVSVLVWLPPSPILFF